MFKGLKEHVRVLGKVNRKGERQLVPVGTLVAYVDNGEVLVGYSKVNTTKKDKFYPENGVDLAEIRAVILKYRLEGFGIRVDRGGFAFVNVDTEPVKERIFPYAIQKALPAFLVRCEKYFKNTPLVKWAALVRQVMPV